MAVPERLESYGVHYALEVGRGVPATAWRDALPPGTRRRAARSTGADRVYRIERHPDGIALHIDDGFQVLSTPRALSDALEGDLALHVAAHAPDHVFIHAGVVAWRGRALVLPGRSMSGKSTLVARLVAAGATYYSDEYAVLDRGGRVRPYPRRLSLRRKRGLPRRITAEAPGRRGLRVGWVVGARYVEQQSGFVLEPISAGRTALLLFDNAVAARLASARVLQTLQQVVGGAAGYVGERGDARVAAKKLLAHCQVEDRRGI